MEILLGEGLGPREDCVDHLLAFTPHFLPPLFQKEFEEQGDMDI